MFLITMIYSSSHGPSFLKKNMELYQFCFAPAIMTDLTDRILCYNKTNTLAFYKDFAFHCQGEREIVSDGRRREAGQIDADHYNRPVENMTRNAQTKKCMKYQEQRTGTTRDNCAVSLLKLISPKCLCN